MIKTEKNNSFKDLSPQKQVEEILKGVNIILKKASNMTENSEDLKKASLYLIKCLQIEPKCVTAYITLANIFKQTKNYDSAIGLLKTVLEIDKNNKIAKDLLLDMKSYIISSIKDSKNTQLKSKIADLEKDLSTSIGSVNAFNFKPKKR